MDGVARGNAANLAANERKRFWFIGHMIESDANRHSKDVEVKWGNHKKGEYNTFNSKEEADKATSVSILIRGRLRISFVSGTGAQDVLLQNEGDFVLWKPGIRHNSMFEEDTTVITIRWPSKGNKQL
jgi:hypothetical protein